MKCHPSFESTEELEKESYIMKKSKEKNYENMCQFFDSDAIGGYDFIIFDPLGPSLEVSLIFCLTDQKVL